MQSRASDMSVINWLIRNAPTALMGLDFLKTENPLFDVTIPGKSVIFV